GVVDLVEMNAKVWRGETKLGETYDTVEIPADLDEQGPFPMETVYLWEDGPNGTTRMTL
ncbi:hypothetical protein HGO75_22920, partial [Mycobacterium tuberculosis]|nr:hypothetical protein [Mycobacterium tuberculosis]